MRYAMVTGGCGAIGRAVTEALLARRVADRVLVVDRTKPAAPLPDEATFHQFDLARSEEVAALAAATPRELSVLVNVVGGERKPPVDPVEDPAWPPVAVWEDIFHLNVTLVYRLVQAVQGRIRPGGAICNVSSIAATMPWVISPAYGAAKAALEHWSATLAIQLADRGVRVNLVRPGFVWSRQWDAVSRDEFDRVVGDRVPLRRRAPGAGSSREQTPADVAATVAFLCSPDAEQVTGQAVNVDGGAASVRAAR